MAVAYMEARNEADLVRFDEMAFDAFHNHERNVLDVDMGHVAAVSQGPYV